MHRHHSLGATEVERYSRQLLLPQFGVGGQEKLKSSRVLIVGVGGLGCPACLYLAGAGVGTLGLVDRPNDVVERSNLHRQLAHADDRVGMNKVDSAEIAVRALNPMVEIEKHERFDKSNAVDLVKLYDLVLDCTDNVISRYLISDACATTRVPLISGSAIGLEGQLTLYCSSAEGPCYRCIFPRPPPPSCVGSCDSAGVLGPVPGTIGTLQALEALKFIAKIKNSETLERKLLLFDAADCSFRTVKLRPRAPSCDVCGESPNVNVSVFDYESFALGGEVNGKAESIPQVRDELRISAAEFAQLRQKGGYKLIDVRPESEYEMCHLPEASSHPLKAMQPSIIEKQNPEDLRTVLICRRGNASRIALQQFLDAGAKNVCDVVGGLESWHHDVDREFPLY